ncbi:MAG: hypothetical protein ABI896_08715 [Actinomycetota bacterium]
MRKQLLYLGLMVVAVLAVGASSTLAARSSGMATYEFNGRLLADAGNSPTLYVQVTGGNRIALKKLLNQSHDQQFSVGPNTEYIRWALGVPSVVPESNLVAGDIVTVKVRADRGASLVQIEATPAVVVADRGPDPRAPRKPLWLFVGTLNAPAADGHLTLHIGNGNLRALRAMLGQPLDQTFRYDRHTLFVLWQGRVPTVISPSQLQPGDKISVRIRAPRGFSLSQVEQVPANHIGDHEPGE